MQVWRLTQAGNARFPDAHAELTVQLLRTIRTELGEEALDKLISAREQETRTNYAAEMADATELRERVARLAAIRTREGYMAEWSEEGKGYLLVENHCPIWLPPPCVRAFAGQNWLYSKKCWARRHRSRAWNTYLPERADVLTELHERLLRFRCLTFHGESSLRRGDGRHHL